MNALFVKFIPIKPIGVGMRPAAGAKGKMTQTLCPLNVLRG